MRLRLLLHVHISCYKQLNSIDFVWLFADRPALQFLAAASRRPAESLQRLLLSSSAILLQNLSCLKSILPPSNDSLKMNARKTDPPRSFQLGAGLHLDQRWRLWERYLLSHCHGSTEGLSLNVVTGLCLVCLVRQRNVPYFPFSLENLFKAKCDGLRFLCQPKSLSSSSLNTFVSKPLLSIWSPGSATHQALVQYHVGRLSHGGQVPSLWPRPQRGRGASLLPGTDQETFL